MQDSLIIFALFGPPSSYFAHTFVFNWPKSAFSRDLLVFVALQVGRDGAGPLLRFAQSLPHHSVYFLFLREEVFVCVGLARSYSSLRSEHELPHTPEGCVFILPTYHSLTLVIVRVRTRARARGRVNGWRMAKWPVQNKLCGQSGANPAKMGLK